MHKRVLVGRTRYTSYFPLLSYVCKFVNREVHDFFCIDRRAEEMAHAYMRKSICLEGSERTIGSDQGLLSVYVYPRLSLSECVRLYVCMCEGINACVYARK